MSRAGARADASQIDRVPFVDRGFIDRVGALSAGEPRGPDDALCGGWLTCRRALELFDSMVESRHLDFCARELKRRGEGFYTIGSAGHEANVAVAAALRPSDPALLHYRSGAFFLERARQAGERDAAKHVLLGVVASSEEPIAGGRHKVFGSRALAIPPQTSTIASHLPKAVGMAFALARAKRVGIEPTVPPDAVVMCSFGDASANHSTALGAVNAACWAAYQGQAVPLLFVCEDNGVGISVATPAGWIAASYRDRPGLRYFYADGLDLAQACEVAREAVEHVRRERKPAFLHLRVVRLLGHAGSDLEATYRPIDDIERAESADPLVAAATLLARHGAATPDELCARYEAARERIAAVGEGVIGRPRLASAEQVMAPLAPRDDDAIAEVAMEPVDAQARERFWGGRKPEDERPAPLVQLLGRALGDLLLQHPEVLVFGEDVGHKGGVYGVTRGLARRARRGRVFDTLLDEQSILGLAIGAGHIGCLPIAEIQYLAYLHNAEDQLRGEAASLQFFSNAQFRNPMVVRIAGYAYQKGFGGHFHNDNSVAVLRDIPGLVIASPARGEDAVGALRTLVAAAKTSGSVCVLLEPIALYPMRDLHDEGDGGWCDAYPAPGEHHVPIGSARVYGDGTDLLLVSWANGLYMSLRAARRLERQHGVRVRVLDLRWLAPLPVAELVTQATQCERVLIVDETRRSGGVSEALITALIEHGVARPMARVTSLDTFIPLGDAANLVLVQESDIERAALSLLAHRAHRRGNGT